MPTIIRGHKVDPVTVRYCYCPGCNYEQPAPPARRCSDLKCPKCGTWMQAREYHRKVA